MVRIIWCMPIIFFAAAAAAATLLTVSKFIAIVHVNIRLTIVVHLVIETDVRVHLLIYINNCGIKRKRSEKGPKPQLFRQRFFVVLRCLKKT